jgi:Flp pilus assembly protein TadD
MLRTALELHPDDPWLHLHLSRLLQRRQRPRGALVAARHAVALAPQKPYLHEHLVKLLIEAGEDDEAEVVSREALELHPDDVGLHSHLSRLLHRRHPAAPMTGKSNAMKVATAAAA